MKYYKKEFLNEIDPFDNNLLPSNSSSLPANDRTIFLSTQEVLLFPWQGEFCYRKLIEALKKHIFGNKLLIGEKYTYS